jgi:hypothetical protein
VQSISVPVLFAAMGGSVFIRDNELAYEVARSPDKDFVVIEGATPLGLHAVHRVRAAKGELLELGEEPVRLCRALD